MKRLMPMSRPSAQATLPGQPATMIPARIKSAMPLRHPRPRAREQRPVIERRQYLGDAVDCKEGGESHGQGYQPGKRPPHQECADEDRQHGAEQGPHKARHIPGREQGGKPHEPAGQEKPARKSFHHQRGDEGRRRGKKTEQRHHESRYQEKHPMVSDRRSEIASEFIHVCHRHGCPPISSLAQPCASCRGRASRRQWCRSRSPAARTGPRPRTGTKATPRAQPRCPR